VSDDNEIEQQGIDFDTPAINVEDLPGFRGHVVPWPGHVDTVGLETEVVQSLNAEQDARTSALHHARQVLEKRGGPFGGGSGSTPPSVDDLIRLSNWILTGEDPM